MKTFGVFVTYPVLVFVVVAWGGFLRTQRPHLNSVKACNTDSPQHAFFETGTEREHLLCSACMRACITRCMPFERQCQRPRSVHGVQSPTGEASLGIIASYPKPSNACRGKWETLKKDIVLLRTCLKVPPSIWSEGLGLGLSIRHLHMRVSQN